MASNTSFTIANALGLGYGINSNDIVTNLVAAAQSPEQNIIRARQNINKAQISALAKYKSAQSYMERQIMMWNSSKSR
ncbi:hypothetical protein [Rhizorhapis sp. SPR117]|uniref:hypothetical protein n=1 Tax=Rhizorhapis sp. SPR117 TaxID=2912611 RepID=UPI001F3DB6B7|nr:hypothetical protein [Rhizorhapis sp. SPR117]